MNQENRRYVLEFGYVSGEGMGREAICLLSKLLDLYKMGNEKSILVKISTRKWWTRTLLTMNQVVRKWICNICSLDRLIHTKIYGATWRNRLIEMCWGQVV